MAFAQATNLTTDFNMNYNIAKYIVSLCLLLSVFLMVSCAIGSEAGGGLRVINGSSKPLQILTPSEFDLNNIDKIILDIDGDLVAIIQPSVVTSSDSDRQRSDWFVEYLAGKSSFNRLAKNKRGYLARLRLIDKVGGLMLDKTRMHIHIGYGTSDDVIVIQPDSRVDGVRNQYRWDYYSSAGRTATGRVFWVLAGAN